MKKQYILLLVSMVLVIAYADMLASFKDIDKILSDMLDLKVTKTVLFETPKK